MPKVLEDSAKEELKLRLLKLLSIDGRMSTREISKVLGIADTMAYKIFTELTKEYDLRFVPEINIDDLWRWEFIKHARQHTKKGILDETVDQLPELGFSEYITLFKFSGAKPKDEEIIKALGDSYIPQFVARLKGEHDLVMYSVARSYNDIYLFIEEFSGRLEKYNVISCTNKIWNVFGFFPLNVSLLMQFNLFDVYKNLLIGISENGRATFADLAAKFRKNLSQFLYAYDRLIKTGIVKRITYYESSPKTTVNGIVHVRIKNVHEFTKTRNKFWTQMVSSYEDKHNEYVFICNISNPYGGLIFTSFKTVTESNAFVSSLRKIMKGVDISYMPMPKILVGSMGVRNFDMKYSLQYQYLESQKLVPRATRRSIDTVPTMQMQDEAL